MVATVNGPVDNLAVSDGTVCHYQDPQGQPGTAGVVMQNPSECLQVSPVGYQTPGGVVIASQVPSNPQSQPQFYSSTSVPIAAGNSGVSGGISVAPQSVTAVASGLVLGTDGDTRVDAGVMAIQASAESSAAAAVHGPSVIGLKAPHLAQERVPAVPAPTTLSHEAGAIADNSTTLVTAPGTPAPAASHGTAVSHVPQHVHPQAAIAASTEAKIPEGQALDAGIVVSAEDPAGGNGVGRVGTEGVVAGSAAYKSGGAVPAHGQGDHVHPPITQSEPNVVVPGQGVDGNSIISAGSVESQYNGAPLSQAGFQAQVEEMAAMHPPLGAEAAHLQGGADAAAAPAQAPSDAVQAGARGPGAPGEDSGVIVEDQGQQVVYGTTPGSEHISSATEAYTVGSAMENAVTTRGTDPSAAVSGNEQELPQHQPAAVVTLSDTPASTEAGGHIGTAASGANGT